MPDQPFSPGANALLQAGAGYQPAATGWPRQAGGPLQGLPGMGTPYGAVAGMMAMPFLHQQFGEIGLAPMGLGQDRNMLDRMQAQQYYLVQMQAMQQAAEADRAAMFDTMRGAAYVTGTPFGPRQRQYANTLAGGLSAMSPFLADAMPDVLDQLGGSRGSAVVLARRMIDAGRYRLDPVTGQMGISGGAAGRAAMGVFEDLFAPHNLQAMHGLRAGQAGALVQELQARGMVRAGDAEGTTLNQCRQMAGMDGGPIDPRDLDKLSLDPQIADRLKALDTDKIKRSIKSYAGAVAAMRDIFGDLGRPGAPMAELMAGLEALTQGSLAQIDPGRLSGLVRQTHNLARATGVQLDAAIAMQQHAAARGQQLGLEPVFGMFAAQGGLAFGGAYRAGGHGAFTAWGAPSADQAQQMDINLRQQGAASNMANRMAVAMRFAGSFAPGSEAAKFVDAIRGGGGDMLRMTDGAFVQMVANGSGMSQGDVISALGQRSLNRGQLAAHPQILDLVRAAQGPDTSQYVGQAISHPLASRFQLLTGDRRAAAQAAAAVGQQVAAGMLLTSTEAISDDGKRERAVSGLIEQGLRGQGLGGKLDAMGAAEKAKFLATAANMAYGSADQYTQQRGWGTYQAYHRANNPTTLGTAAQIAEESRLRSDRQNDLDAMGQGTWLTNLVDAVREMQPDDPDGVKGVLFRALGGVDKEQINQALLPHVTSFLSSDKSLEDLDRQISLERNPVAKANMIRRREGLRTARQAAGRAAVGAAERFGGLMSGDSLSKRDTARLADSLVGLREANRDLVGLTGGFNKLAGADDVRLATRSEIASVMAENKGMSEEDAETLARARLRRDRFGVGAEVLAYQKANSGMSEADAITVVLRGKDRFADPNLSNDEAGKLQAQQRANFKAFWHSDLGMAYSDTVKIEEQRVGEMVDKLVRSPETFQRLGMGAVDLSNQLREGQDRLAAIAGRYADGSRSRAILGDFNLDLRNPENRKLRNDLLSEVRQIRSSQYRIMDYRKDFDDGKRFILSDQDEALRLLGIKSGSQLTSRGAYAAGQLAANVGVMRGLSPEQQTRLMDAMRSGDDAVIEATAADMGLTPDQLRGVAGTADLYMSRHADALKTINSAGREDVARALLKEYGFKPGEGPLDADAKRAADMMMTPRGLEIGRQMLLATQHLKAIAKRGIESTDSKDLNSLDQMADEFTKAGTDKSAFRTKFGLGDDTAYRKFQDELEVARTLRNFSGPDGIANRRLGTSKVSDLADYLQERGAPSSGGQGGPHGPTEIRGVLELIIKDDKLRAALTAYNRDIQP